MAQKAKASVLTVQDIIQIAGCVMQQLPRVVVYQRKIYVWYGCQYVAITPTQLRRRIERVDQQLTLGMTPELLGRVRKQITVLTELQDSNSTPPFVLPADYDSPATIPTADGIIPLQNAQIEIDATGTLSVQAPLDGLFNTHAFPVDYDPPATCPRFDQCVTEWFPEATQQRLLWEMLAYLLLPHNRFKKIFIFYGPMNTGKTLLQRVIEALLGRGVCAGVPLHKLGGNEKQALVGKYVNFAAEAKYASADVCEELKVYSSGGDFTTTDVKYKNPLSYQPILKMIITGNDDPHFASDDTALWGRLMLLHFHEPPTRDPGLFDVLRKELPGILAKALAVLPGLVQNQFSPCPVSEELLQNCRTEVDNVTRFVEDRCRFPSDPPVEQEKDYVYTCYRAYCEANGEKKNEFGRVRFWKRLYQVCEEMGHPLVPHNRTKYGKQVKVVGSLEVSLQECEQPKYESDGSKATRIISNFVGGRR